MDVPASSQRTACVENVRLRLSVVLCSCAQNKFDRPNRRRSLLLPGLNHGTCAACGTSSSSSSARSLASFPLTLYHAVTSTYLTQCTCVSPTRVFDTRPPSTHVSQAVSLCCIQTRDAHRSLSSARHDGIEKIIASTSCGRRWASRARCCHCRARSCDGQP